MKKKGFSMLLAAVIALQSVAFTVLAELPAEDEIAAWAELSTEVETDFRETEQNRTVESPAVQDIQVEERLPEEEFILEDSYEADLTGEEDISFTEGDSFLIEEDGLFDNPDAVFEEDISDSYEPDNSPDEAAIPAAEALVENNPDEETDLFSGEDGEIEESEPEGDMLQAGALPTWGTFGNLSWRLENRVLTISGTGPMDDVVFSEEEVDVYYDGDPFPYVDFRTVSTAPWSFSDFDTVVIENGVTSIGSYAFYQCSALSRVIIPDSVTKIGSYAFSAIDSLQVITIPESVSEIGEAAFYKCYKLKTVNVPHAVSRIEDYTFSFCGSLTSMVLPEGLTYIGSQAFSHDVKLETIVFDGDASSIMDDAFSHTNVILAFYDPQKEGWPDNPTGDYGAQAIIWVKKGDPAPDVLHMCGDNLFWRVDSGVLTITGSGEMWNYEDGEPGWKTAGMNEAVLPDGITGIGACAFKDCSTLTSISLPDSVTHIGESAFMNAGLLSVEIPGSIGRIEKNTFEGCGTLRSVKIAEGVKSIGESAFLGCKGLPEVTIPDSVTVIERRAFENCSGLKKVVLHDGFETLGDSVFCGCIGLAETVLPSDLKEIPESFFRGCSSLKKIDLPSGLVTIGHYAFSKCRSLNGITFPPAVTTIHWYAFSECTALSELEIPESITFIGRYAFSGCSGLKTINLLGRVPDFSCGEDIFEGVTATAYYRWQMYPWSSGSTYIEDIEVQCKGKINWVPVPASIRLSADSVTVAVGKTQTITASNLVTGDKIQYWGAEDSSVASVAVSDKAVAIKGKKVGTTTVILTLLSGLKARIKVTVKDSVDQPKLIAAYNGAKGIGVKFCKVNSATEYVIYQKFNGVWKSIRTISAASKELQFSGNTIMYTDTTVAKNYGKGYIYSVAAKKGNVTSKYDTKGVAIYRLKPPTLSKAVNSSAGTATVSWKGVFGKTETNGNYDLQAAEYANGKAGTFRSIKKLPGYNNLTLSAKVTGLMKGKTYVFRIRCSKTNKDRGTFYSEYSPWLSMKM